MTVNSRIHKIIHTAATAAAGIASGMAQVPGSDNAVITPIQIAMIQSLAKVHGRDINESAALTILASVSAGTVGRAISQFLVGWVPGLGNVVNASTAFTITEAIGWSANEALAA